MARKGKSKPFDPHLEDGPNVALGGVAAIEFFGDVPPCYGKPMTFVEETGAPLMSQHPHKPGQRNRVPRYFTESE